jgi:hypothetical protein
MPCPELCPVGPGQALQCLAGQHPGQAHAASGQASTGGRSRGTGKWSGRRKLVLVQRSRTATWVVSLDHFRWVLLAATGGSRPVVVLLQCRQFCTSSSGGCGCEGFTSAVAQAGAVAAGCGPDPGWAVGRERAVCPPGRHSLQARPARRVRSGGGWIIVPCPVVMPGCDQRPLRTGLLYGPIWLPSGWTRGR